MIEDTVVDPSVACLNGEQTWLERWLDISKQPVHPGWEIASRIWIGVT